MATYSMDCSMVSLAYAKDGSWNDQSAENIGFAGASAGASYGDSYYDGYYTCCLKFRTPKFAGISERIKFQIGIHYIGNNDTTLRWALCSSDANKGKYSGDGIYSEVEDEYQIAQGTVVWEDLFQTDDLLRELTVETNALKPETEYYLFLWSFYDKYYIYTAVRVAAAAEHSAVVEYKAGLIQGKHNGQMHSCVVDVVAGGVWKQTMPEVAANGAWKPGC